jgi:hypothetical protein
MPPEDRLNSVNRNQDVAVGTGRDDTGDTEADAGERMTEKLGMK